MTFLGAPKSFSIFLFFVLTSSAFIFSNKVSAQESDLQDDDEDEVVSISPFTEEQRLKGFHYHQKFNREFDIYRMSGVASIKKDRRRWEQLMAATLPEFKKQRSGEKKILDETSPEYRRHNRLKDEYSVWLEGARKRYVKARDLARVQKQKRITLSEAEEYDLVKVRERVEIAKRPLYTGKVAKSKGDGVTSGGASGTSGPQPTSGFESTPAPPPPAMTGVSDFYEPDIPPPPPPPAPMPMDGMGGFEDSVQPPIFDEPEF